MALADTYHPDMHKQQRHGLKRQPIQPGGGSSGPGASAQSPLNSQGPGPSGANLPSCSQSPGMWYCYGFGETYGQSYGGFVEHGNDNDTPFHTPLYMLYGGTVTDASYHGWGGQVGVSTSVPGYGNLIEYIQHLDLIDPSIQPGAVIQPGQYVGLSGGQIGYGYHPEDPQYTSGPHTEFGFGAPWVNGAQGCSFGASCNPNSDFAFQAARAGQLNGSIGGGPGPIPPGGGFGFDPCSIPFLSWMCNPSGSGPGSLSDILIRALLVISGAVLMYIGASKLFSGSVQIATVPQDDDAQHSMSPPSFDDKKDDEEEGDEEEDDDDARGSATPPTERPDKAKSSNGGGKAKAKSSGKAKSSSGGGRKQAPKNKKPAQPKDERTKPPVSQDTKTA